ncbi:MAG: hypothetical protein QXR48_03740 [Candidatus Woesearchaeota archaeon]
MGGDEKKYLPAKAEKFTLARLEQFSEIAIPPQFQGTTSLSEVTNARKAERKGISKRKELEELVEDDDVSESKIRIEEMERSHNIRAFVIAKSDQLLCSLNVGSMDELGDLSYFIYHGMREDAVKILLNAGAKQKKAEKTVEKLIRLFDYFRDDLENFGEKIELSKEQSKSFERDIIETVRAVNEARKKNKIKQTDDEEQADFNEQTLDDEQMDGDET